MEFWKTDIDILDGLPDFKQVEKQMEGFLV
jgi:hypothetical protein